MAVATSQSQRSAATAAATSSCTSGASIANRFVVTVLRTKPTPRGFRFYFIVIAIDKTVGTSHCCGGNSQRNLTQITQLFVFKTPRRLAVQRYNLYKIERPPLKVASFIYQVSWSVGNALWSTPSACASVPSSNRERSP